MKRLLMMITLLATSYSVHAIHLIGVKAGTDWVETQRWRSCAQFYRDTTATPNDVVCVNTRSGVKYKKKISSNSSNNSSTANTKISAGSSVKCKKLKKKVSKVCSKAHEKRDKKLMKKCKAGQKKLRTCK
jgi:hypothetical protein